MKFKRKIIATILLMILLCSNLLPIGDKVIALSSELLYQDELLNQNSKTNSQNVEFNSYLEGYTHEKTFNMAEVGKLYINVNIKDNGYLKNGIVKFNNSNYQIDSSQIKSKYIQKIENNVIYLSQIKGGEQFTLELPITFVKNNKIDSEYFSKNSEVIFNGKYISGEAEEKSIEKTIYNKINWTVNAQIETDAIITKFMPYQIDKDYGLVLQSKVNVGIKENVLPIKNTNLEIDMPIINDKKPDRVTVITNSTKATNGVENEAISNFEYNDEEGIVTIQTTNEPEQNNITWGEGKDEYILTCIYTGKEIYDYIQEQLQEAKEERLTAIRAQDENIINEQAIIGKILIKANIETYDKEVEQIQLEKEVPYSIEEEIGELSDFNITAPAEISKAYLYANYDKTENKNETKYELSYSTQVYDTNLNKQIQFEIRDEKLKINDDLFLASGNIYVKQIKISEKTFTKILGESGRIDVLKKDGAIIGSISKENAQNNILNGYLDSIEGNYVLNIEDLKLSQIVIKTTEPEGEGNLTITIEKAFSIQHNYTRNEMKEFTAIETEAVLNTKSNSKTVKSEIKLNEVTSKAEINIKEENLSTVVVNKGIQIRAILDTSSLDYALYKNPTLKIKLPEYVDNIVIKNKDIIMDNGLKIEDVQVEKENGIFVIVVKLSGEQKDYTIGAEYKGTIIIIDTDITVNPLIPTVNSKIDMIYKNNNEVVENKEEKVETKVNFIAPTGVLAVNALSNYNTNGKTIMSISSKTEEAILETYSEKKIAKVTGTIVNNYGNEITKVIILGRIPAKGSKKIDTQEDLEATFEGVIKSEIQVKGLQNYKIYYSENIEAGLNLEEESNKWTEKYSDKTKSYMIVAEESYKMKEHETIEFSYDLELPENLSYNNNSYEMYKVYYTNLSEVGIMKEAKESAVIGLTTGEGAELDVKLESTAEVIREGQIVKMNVTAENKGNITLTNAKINISKPDYATFVSYTTTTGFEKEQDLENKVISLGAINPGDIITRSYYIQIDSQISRQAFTGEDGKKYYIDKNGEPVQIEGEVPEPEITNKVIIIGDEAPNGIPSNEVKNKIEVGEIEIKLIGSTLEEVSLTEGKGTRLWVRIRRINKGAGTEDLHNVEVKIPLVNFELVNATIGTSASYASGESDNIVYNEDSKELTVKIDTLTKEQQIIYMELKAEQFAGSNLIMVTAKAENGETHYSNALQVMCEKPNLQISELISSPKYVKEGENITYQLSIKNNGKSIINNINIIDELPEELSLVEAYYEFEGERNSTKETTENTLSLRLASIYPGTTRTFIIIAKAKALENKEEKKVNNKIKITANLFDGAETNIVTNIIEYNEQLHQNPSIGENPEEPDVPTTHRYKITGVAWLDENKDGKHDKTEKLLSNIPVILLDKSNNSIVQDVDTKIEKRVVTSNSGKYEFSNIPKGEYLVIFLYDASNYSLTKYQAEDIATDLNSDVIDINVIFEGEKRIAGITDVISITDTNARDIDIGLYISEKFDLRIDKYISKITLTTPTIGKRVTEYDNTQLAKVEILGKNVNKSSIIVEYKIKVTNQGKVAGYAKKLIDYLPEDCLFVSEINNDWYLSDNNQNVYNTSLANEIINPGESKEVTLVLGFNITDKNIGNIINNNAEIYESYNEQGIKDIDSIEGNKASDEDDISKADIVLSIVTGKIVLSSILIILIITLIAISIYEIKKRVLTKKIN